MILAVSGKGGSGKTVVSAFLVKHLSKKFSLLAVDADPSTSLPDAVGRKIGKTLGDVREKFREEELPPGIDKKLWLESKVMEIISPSEDFDLLAIGRPEGPECYCAVNHLLREIIDTISGNYEMIVIDAEAGMEQLSRRTLKDVDTLLILTDPSIPGLRSARRILELSKNLRIGFRSSWILANKVRNESQRRMIGEYVARENLPLIGEIPWDEEVEKADFDGRPLIDLEGKAEEAIGEIIKKLGIWT